MTSQQQDMLKEFAGCDAWAPPEKGSIWLFGIEHGWPKNAEDINNQRNAEGDTYSIKTQRKYPYNRNAFKLLTVIAGRPISEWIDYAEEKQPFVKGSKGFFKGNLFVYPCYKTGAWTDAAIRETGFSDKKEYQKWCREKRLPVIHDWINKYAPSIFIGVGNQNFDDFSLACFGKLKEPQEKEKSFNGYTKRLYCAQEINRKLVVVPHLSGGKNGLNSNASLEWAGKFIRDFILP